MSINGRYMFLASGTGIMCVYASFSAMVSERKSYGPANRQTMCKDAHIVSMFLFSVPNALVHGVQLHLLHQLSQAVEGGVTLISPFVGRVTKQSSWVQDVRHGVMWMRSRHWQGLAVIYGLSSELSSIYQINYIADACKHEHV